MILKVDLFFCKIKNNNLMWNAKAFSIKYTEDHGGGFFEISSPK